MFTFRYTRKLIRSYKVDIEPSPPLPTMRLGDRYGNIFFPCHSRLMIFTSELPLLSVAMPLREGKGLLFSFRSRADYVDDLVISNISQPMRGGMSGSLI